MICHRIFVLFKPFNIMQDAFILENLQHYVIASIKMWGLFLAGCFKEAIKAASVLGFDKSTKILLDVFQGY